MIELIEAAIINEIAITTQDICKQLAMSRQTLYRALNKENTDFKTLYDQSKSAYAHKWLIEDKLSITQVGLKLRFKDSSSFYKAFKRWYGVSPKQYLQNNSLFI